MRTSLRLTALVAALAGALLLAGCGTQPQRSAPSSSAAPTPASAVDLVPVIWRVRDAKGEAPATWVRFQPGDVEVFRPKGFIDFGWAVQGSEMSTLIVSWSGTLGMRPMVPWLSNATGFQRDGAGWRLVDASGAVTARLVEDGSPPKAADWETDVPVVDARARAALADAVAGEGVVPLDTSALVGRWGVAGRDSATPSVTFTAAGRWQEKASCDTGTNDAPGVGGYRLLPSGMLLITTGAVAGVGCSAPKTPLWSTSGVKAINGMAQARSVRIQGTTATFYDHARTAIGSLTRQN